MLRPFKIAVGHPDVRYIASPCSIAVVGCGLLWLDTWCLAPWCYTVLVRFKQYIAKALGGRQMITSPSHPFFKMPDDNWALLTPGARLNAGPFSRKRLSGFLLLIIMKHLLNRGIRKHGNKLVQLFTTFARCFHLFAICLCLLLEINVNFALM